MSGKCNVQSSNVLLLPRVFHTFRFQNPQGVFSDLKASQNSRIWKKQFTWARLPINKDRKNKGPWQNPWFETGRSIIWTNYTTSPTCGLKWVSRAIGMSAGTQDGLFRQVTNERAAFTNLDFPEVRWFPFLNATFWSCDVASHLISFIAPTIWYTTLGTNISFCQRTFEPGSSEWPFWWIEVTFSGVKWPPFQLSKGHLEGAGRW